MKNTYIKPVKVTYSNKWASPPELISAFCDLVFFPKQSFSSGYYLYPDDFDEENSDSRDIFKIKDFPHFVLVNPPFDALIKHLFFLLQQSFKNQTSTVAVSPYRINDNDFCWFLYHPFVVAFVFENPISFLQIDNNYQHRDVCPDRQL